MRICRGCGVAMAGACLLLAAACDEKRPAKAAAPVVVAPVPTDPNLMLERPAMMLGKGATEAEVLAAFREVKWDDPGAGFTTPALNVPEAEFLKLSQWEQSQIVGAALEVGGNVRRLARVVVAEARRLAAAGEREEAMKLLAGLRSLGVTMADPEKRLEIVRLVGAAIVQFADATKEEIGEAP